MMKTYDHISQNTEGSFAMCAFILKQPIINSHRIVSHWLLAMRLE